MRRRSRPPDLSLPGLPLPDLPLPGRSLGERCAILFSFPCCRGFRVCAIAQRPWLPPPWRAGGRQRSARASSQPSRAFSSTTRTISTMIPAMVPVVL